MLDRLTMRSGNRFEPDVVARGSGREEPEQPTAFLEDGGLIRGGQRPDRHDDQGRRAALALQVPAAEHEAVHQQRAAGEDAIEVLANDRPVAEIAEEPGPVLVRQGDVVVGRQEARRSGRVGVGQRGIGQVEELAAGLTALRWLISGARSAMTLYGKVTGLLVEGWIISDCAYAVTSDGNSEGILRGNVSTGSTNAPIIRPPLQDAGGNSWH